MVTRRLLSFGVALALGAATLVGVTPSANAGFTPGVGDCLEIDPETFWSGAIVEGYPWCDSREHNAEIYYVAPYPKDFPPPSELGDRVRELWGLCSQKAFYTWLGIDNSRMPLRIYKSIVIPTDVDWQNDEGVLCIAALFKDGLPQMMTETIPAQFAATPLTDWLVCLNSAPKSGKPYRHQSCTSKAKWIMVNGVMVKGKITSQYPKDLQAKADKLCLARGKPLLKSGWKTAPVAALLPKEDIGSGPAFAECFIAYSEWTGKLT